MKHLHTISRMPFPAQNNTSPLESVIILLFSIFFQGWDNFSAALQGLQKFYSKTPD